MVASLTLPPPRRVSAPLALSEPVNVEASKEQPKVQQEKLQHPPSYDDRCAAAASLAKLTGEARKGKKLFVPRSLKDFGDGGAFPEIHVAQYPRHMGNPHLKKGTATSSNTKEGPVHAGSSRALVNVQIDKKGGVSYDSIVKRGTNQDKIVYSNRDALKGGPGDTLALPTEEEEKDEAAKTNAALQALVNPETKPEESQFIQYTARPDAPGYNPAAAQRVIQMVPKQIDPLQPPKHKHFKTPMGPPEDPVPILHAPVTKKLTKEERDAWNVPACVSNWKNMRGYTIPLDKRLAADGRGLQEHTINPNFATLSESLYEAEKQARQEVRLRAQVQKKLALQVKEEREEKLREMAAQARRSVPDSDMRNRTAEVTDEVLREGTTVVEQESSDEDDDSEGARQREQMRRERKRERERELRMERMGHDEKKARLERERDVSEKIALGVQTGDGGGAGEVDARLYSQTGGISSGFGADDDYNTYTKPLFNSGATSASIYRPSRGEAADADSQYQQLVEGATSKFRPDKGFAGAEGGSNVQAGPRQAPVQFEKEK